MFHAHITNGIVTSITQNNGALDGKECIQLETFDVSLIGQAYADGVFTPVDQAEKHIPTRVTMAKAQIAMSRKGVLKAVDAAIQEMPGTAGDEARIQWSKEPFVNRSAPLVAVLASAFKWSDEYVDELFVLADSIP